MFMQSRLKILTKITLNARYSIFLFLVFGAIAFGKDIKETIVKERSDNRRDIITKNFLKKTKFLHTPISSYICVSLF